MANHLSNCATGIDAKNGFTYKGKSQSKVPLFCGEWWYTETSTAHSYVWTLVLYFST